MLRPLDCRRLIAQRAEVVSTSIVILRILAGVVCAAACFAQQYELGGTIGYGFYRDVRINSPGGQADVGIRDRFAAGAVFCEDPWDHISGEVRYLYHDGDPFISANGRRANIQGQSHTVSYDVLFHFRNRDEKFRPYAAAGVGAKYYRTTGPEPSPQPLPGIAQLVHVSEWEFAADVGFGVKYRIHQNVILRGDFRDYITPFPKKLWVPANGATDRGLFQQFTPMFGISYSF